MNKTRLYRIAEQNILITSIHDRVHEYCKEYLAEDDVPLEKCLRVCTSQADIEYEREQSAREDQTEGRKVREWSDDYLEELAVYRSIAEQMPDHNTFLLHGSAVCVDGEAYLFTGRSGIGKSTHVRLWQELLGGRLTVINDDKPLVRLKENQAVIYGTPYNGKHRSGNNISAPLKAICMLGQAEHNHIEQISKKDAFPLLLQQSYRSANPETMPKIILLVSRLADLVQFWKLDCNMDISAARLSFNTMSGIDIGE